MTGLESQRILYSVGNYIVARWPEADSDGQMTFAIVDTVSNRIEHGIGSDRPAYAIRYARGFARGLAKQTSREAQFRVECGY
jgi:hypothetical protein